MGHENIIKYYSHFVEEGFLYILQEYAEGGSLFDYLLPSNPLDEEISIKMIYQILRGLENMHNNEIVHRDIKAENIIIGHDGILKIVDLGFCCSFKESLFT